MDMESVDGETKAGRSQQPCAGCRMLRRRCDSKCLLAPYFPTDEVDKFVGVHKVFGASSVIKMIQTVEEAKREDAVKAIVYEAMARLRDPVYGSAGSIFHFQKKIKDLKAELESLRNQVSDLREQNHQLLMTLHNNNKASYGYLMEPDDILFPSVNLDGGCTTPLSLSAVDLEHLMAFDSIIST